MPTELHIKVIHARACNYMGGEKLGPIHCHLLLYSLLNSIDTTVLTTMHHRHPENLDCKNIILNHILVCSTLLVLTPKCEYTRNPRFSITHVPTHTRVKSVTCANKQPLSLLQHSPPEPCLPHKTSEKPPVAMTHHGPVHCPGALEAAGCLQLV